MSMFVNAKFSVCLCDRNISRKHQYYVILQCFLHTYRQLKQAFNISPSSCDSRSLVSSISGAGAEGSLRECVIVCQDGWPEGCLAASRLIDRSHVDKLSYVDEMNILSLI